MLHVVQVVKPSKINVWFWAMYIKFTSETGEQNTRMV